jgi:hypothetical protein
MVTPGSDPGMSNRLEKRFIGICRRPCLVLAAAFCLMSGCAIDRPRSANVPSPVSSVERQCGPSSGFRVAPAAELRDNVPLTAGIPEPGVLSPRALEVVHIIGADDLVAQLHVPDRNRPEGNTEARLHLLQVRQQLTLRILLALLDVKSAAAEADCEETRADDVADRLQDEQEKKATRFTVLSLLGSGVGGALSGGLALAAQAVAAGIVGIAAGVTEATFGSMALSADTRHEFRHERNLLKEIWEAPKTPKLFPESVWRFLNRPMRHDPAHRSLRETLIARWYKDGRLGEPDSETERHRKALFFGGGGTYTADELRDRAVMLDMVESDVNLMSHDLEHLLQELLSQLMR